MVIRQEGERIRRYIHLATGNYNHFTSSTYEDIGVFTCDEAIGADSTDLFNFLTGYSMQTEYRKLLVAPVNLRQKLEAFIQREITHAKKRHKAQLIFKLNSLVDPHMIQLLYKASQAGVKVDLFIRGMCCLRPGLKNVSENIRVVSFVGRYLEHSRIYSFHNNGKEEIYLGSADLMERNLDNRVEVVFPIENPEHVQHLRENVLAAYYRDNTRSRIMKSDGKYTRIKPREKDEKFDI
jgi:polyphosphate kinase